MKSPILVHSSPQKDFLSHDVVQCLKCYQTAVVLEMEYVAEQWGRFPAVQRVGFIPKLALAPAAHITHTAHYPLSPGWAVPLRTARITPPAMSQAVESGMSAVGKISFPFVLKGKLGILDIGTHFPVTERKGRI